MRIADLSDTVRQVVAWSDSWNARPRITGMPSVRKRSGSPRPVATGDRARLRSAMRRSERKTVDHETLKRRAGSPTNKAATAGSAAPSGASIFTVATSSARVGPTFMTAIGMPVSQAR